MELAPNAVVVGEDEGVEGIEGLAGRAVNANGGGQFAQEREQPCAMALHKRQVVKHNAQAVLPSGQQESADARDPLWVAKAQLFERRVEYGKRRPGAGDHFVDGEARIAERGNDPVGFAWLGGSVNRGH